MVAQKWSLPDSVLSIEPSKLFCIFNKQKEANIERTKRRGESRNVNNHRKQVQYLDKKISTIFPQQEDSTCNDSAKKKENFSEKFRVGGTKS